MELFRIPLEKHLTITICLTKLALTMKKLLLLSLGLTLTGLSAQEVREASGGGGYFPEKTECVSAAEYQRIHQMLSTNREQLAQKGLLATTTISSANEPGGLIWPVVNHNGLEYNSAYCVTNYVDHNPSYPGNVLDWNCGERTYDLNSGYNHQGIDIATWPFSQQLQENDLVAIVAAKAGTIIGKDDGNFDKNCSMSGAQWNAVYILGSDGYTYWYGHMKNNSLTNKSVGESVAQGEFLGIIGSSGSSTGPHLHFEMYDANNNLTDPYNGPCNNVPSLWENQKPYYEPTINTLMTHSSYPEFPSCPQLEIVNEKNYFETGDSLCLAIYLHDQTHETQVLLTVTKPDGTHYSSWYAPQLQEGIHYPASYWYWNTGITADMEDGEWSFSATLNGNTQVHHFYVNVDPTSTPIMTDSDLVIYPNPGNENFTISGLDYGEFLVEVVDMAGKIVYKSTLKSNDGELNFQLNTSAGFYIVQLKDDKGQSKRGKIIVQ